MKNTNPKSLIRDFQNSAFTLVELLVVITILSIISVVAYQNFGGAVDKAVSGRKISDVSTIESSLQQYKVDKNYYPSVDEVDPASNQWGYDNSQVAKASNNIDVDYDDEAIDTIGSNINGGGRVMGINGLSAVQIGAKGTISRDKLTKKYLSKDLYDPELGDIAVGTSGGKMMDYGVGRYVYGIYKKSTSGNWTFNKSGSAYNVAFTIKDTGADTYKTMIVGDYDEESCTTSTDCPPTLIGSGGDTIDDSELLSSDNTLSTNQGIPYPVTDFAQE